MSDDIESKRDRSPNYPQVELEKAVESVCQIYNEAGRNVMNYEIAAKALGYGSLHGPARGLIAALLKYGLLNREGPNNIRISDSALKIVYPTDEGALMDSLKAAALSPPLFANIHSNYHDSSEAILTNRLIHGGFTKEGAKKAAKIYKANCEFAKLGETSYSAVSRNAAAQPEMKVSQISPAMDISVASPPASTKSLLATYRLPVDQDTEAEIRFIGKDLKPDAFDALIEFLEVIKKRFKRTE